MTPTDEAQEAVAALARAIRRVQDAADAVGAAHDPHLEFDLDALAHGCGDALIEFHRATSWPEAQP